MGDTVTVELATGGPQELTVAGIHADAAYVGNYFIDLELFDGGIPHQRPRRARVRPAG